MRETTMKRRDRGQVLVLVALGIFVLLDLPPRDRCGVHVLLRHELQRCADAGALAGASAVREFRERLQ